MTHLERFNASIARKPFDRIPFTLSMTGEAAENLSAYFGRPYLEILYGEFDTDVRHAGPAYTGPAPEKNADGAYKNIFGVTKRDVSYGRGKYSEAVGFPLSRAETVSDVKNFHWPKACDHDFGAPFEILNKYPDYPFMVGYHSLGWVSWEMRGMETFLTDLYENPGIAGAIIEEVADYGYEYYRLLLGEAKSQGAKNFSMIQLADDWATQESLLISVEMFRKHFKPHYGRIIEMARGAGVFVEFHCCGAQSKLIPEFIDLGVDIVNPLQTSAAGMDPAFLKREYGRDIAFSGGIDVQTVLPMGNPESVRDEVFRMLEIMGAGGGYVLAPSHSIQTDVPVQNVVAMVNAVKDFYR